MTIRSTVIPPSWLRSIEGIRRLHPSLSAITEAPLIQRRTFLKTSAAATAALAVPGPILLGTQDKAGSKTPRVGTGEHTYECHHDWGTLPGEFEWQTTHNVTIDSEGMKNAWTRKLRRSSARTNATRSRTGSSARKPPIRRVVDGAAASPAPGRRGPRR